jgi:sortase A
VKRRRALAFVLATIGIGCVAQASWIHVKAYAAQVLIQRAWFRAEKGEARARPWPWADTSPIARLTFTRSLQKLGDQLVVLEGSSGRNLAFGPTHDPASVSPGEIGNSVIAGHRDTHFEVLEGLRVGDVVRVERPDGKHFTFTVTNTAIADSLISRISLSADTPRITLVTCYPFHSLDHSGSLRYVVTAELVGQEKT